MHLLLARSGSVAEGGEAVDLGQSPGDVVFLSSADTELAGMAAAARRLADDGPTLRLANILRLSHPMSVDTYVERTLRHARLVVVRLLGGAPYWRHGLEQLLSLSQRFGVAIAALPGDDRPDPSLDPFCTVSTARRDLLWRCLVEGGPENAETFLLGCHAIVHGEEWQSGARPLLKAGVLARPHVASAPSHSPIFAPSRPLAAVVFYRALLQSGQTGPVETLCRALEEAGLDALPVYIQSLKDEVSVETLRVLFARRAPDIVVNLTGFAVSTPGTARVPTVLEEGGAVVLQAVLASGRFEDWQASARGLSARDLAMSVALPEVDGRVLSRAIAFKAAAEWDALTQCEIVEHRAVPDRVRFVAELAAAWARLRGKAAGERQIAIVLANYPNRDGRLGNGVGLDTPAGTIEVLRALAAAGYDVAPIPPCGNALIEHLMAGPTNAGTTAREIRETLPLAAYRAFFDTLPETVRLSVTQRWGGPEDDPFFDAARGFLLPLSRFGRVLLGIQPARGYNIDPKATYHAPDLSPPHNYLAFYAFLRGEFAADAIVHMGKHGNIEWLPGKALALSQDCFPEGLLGPMPHLYPFIVNDPGEGTQAKRRTSAVIVDHLTPPLTRAESYGPLRDLEALIDEYYDASGSDPKRVALLAREIVERAEASGLAEDAGVAVKGDPAAVLERLDAYLCDLKEMQIRDGLHVFGRAPEGRLLADLAVALARLPRGLEPADASLHRSLVHDLFGDDLLGAGTFDPLDCDMAAVWSGPRPQLLQRLSTDPWRSVGDTVERLEVLTSRLVSGDLDCDIHWLSTGPVMEEIRTRILPSIAASGPGEIAGLLAGLDGRFVAPGPSGAPSRGRPDVLPTGRNFYSVDTRAIPTPAAWTLGKASAELLVLRHLQDEGEWPTSVGLTAWGTANMRTGGDDIAQGLALIGVKPQWDMASRRVTGFEIVTLASLGRPRVDVTLRISGFFRDAFPEQIALFDRAARAVGALDEDEADNPIAARMQAERTALEEGGIPAAEAARLSGFRVFGARPGAYGAGLQALIDEKGWTRRAELGESYIVWGGYAYGGVDAAGEAQRAAFETRLSSIDAIVQNQDNREHDLLDSDDYYQFEGGMAAAVEHLSGARPRIYHNDHSRPERPVVRTLEEEIGRVVRARVVNPKWIAGVMRHGYKGAFEIAATVDYLFAFAATTGAVRDHHFDAVHQAFVADEAVKSFMRANNEPAWNEMNARLMEAIERGLWSPRSNSARTAELDRPMRRGAGEGRDDV